MNNNNDVSIKFVALANLNEKKIIFKRCYDQLTNTYIFEDQT